LPHKQIRAMRAALWPIVFSSRKWSDDAVWYHPHKVIILSISQGLPDPTLPGKRIKASEDLSGDHSCNLTIPVTVGQTCGNPREHGHWSQYFKSSL
jgi:hypothetical protein